MAEAEETAALDESNVGGESTLDNTNNNLEDSTINGEGGGEEAAAAAVGGEEQNVLDESTVGEGGGGEAVSESGAGATGGETGGGGVDGDAASKTPSIQQQQQQQQEESSIGGGQSEQQQQQEISSLQQLQQQEESRGGEDESFDAQGTSDLVAANGWQGGGVGAAGRSAASSSDDGRVDTGEGVRAGDISGALRATHDLPAALEVEVDMGPNAPPRVLHVTVTYAAARKPFLGGFRHKHSKIEYHHASSQTDAEKKKEALAVPTVKFHRDTQTATYKSRSQQNYREFATQMPRPDFHVDDADDYYITSRDYFDSEKLSDLRLKKAIVIQCYARGMFARTRARKLWAELEESRIAAEAEEKKRAAEIAEQQQAEIERRMHPRSEEDFEVLYEELEAWRFAESEKIKQAEMPVPEKRGANYQLLLKEVKLVQTIDRLKTVAAKENREERIEKQLKSMAEAKLWEMRDGTVTSVHTPFTTRAKELMDLYYGLRLQDISVDERLDVLLHVKWTVKEFETPLTLELEELIDREADLLNRGRADRSLEGLRKRITNLFLDFIETPEFNPEASRFRKMREGNGTLNLSRSLMGSRASSSGAATGRLRTTNAPSSSHMRTSTVSSGSIS